MGCREISEMLYYIVLERDPFGQNTKDGHLKLKDRVIPDWSTWDLQACSWSEEVLATASLCSSAEDTETPLGFRPPPACALLPRLLTDV